MQNLVLNFRLEREIMWLFKQNYILRRDCDGSKKEIEDSFLGKRIYEGKRYKIGEERRIIN